MAKGVVWTAQAKADLRAVEKDRALQILKTIARFAKHGSGDTKQLEGIHPPLIRLRAQDHRVLFRDSADEIEILRVLDRKDAYR